MVNDPTKYKETPRMKMSQKRNSFRDEILFDIFEIDSRKLRFLSLSLRSKLAFTKLYCFSNGVYLISTAPNTQVASMYTVTAPGTVGR